VFAVGAHGLHPHGLPAAPVQQPGWPWQVALLQNGFEVEFVQSAGRHTSLAYEQTFVLYECPNASTLPSPGGHRYEPSSMHIELKSKQAPSAAFGGQKEQEY
jgi:hypothetical protein